MSEITTVRFDGDNLQAVRDGAQDVERSFCALPSKQLRLVSAQ